LTQSMPSCRRTFAGPIGKRWFGGAPDDAGQPDGSSRDRHRSCREAALDCAMAGGRRRTRSGAARRNHGALGKGRLSAPPDAGRRMSDFRDLVIVDLAAEVAALMDERRTYRELATTAMHRMAEQQRAIDQYQIRIRDQANEIRRLSGFPSRNAV